ncbi:hypothetical protein [Anaerosporobacter sp.]
MKKGLKLLLTAIIITIGISLSACKELMENEEPDEVIAMTDEQRDLLIEMSFDEEGVKEGKLSEWQIEVLRQFDSAKEYLERKYPSHTFKIIRGESNDIFHDFTEFIFIADDDDEWYDMRIDIEKKDSGDVYAITDNYSGVLLKEKYEEELLKVLQKECKQCVAVHVDMSSMDGEEVNETFDVNRIIDEGFEVTHHTTIFINGQDEADPLALVKQVKDLIKEKRIYGSYIVYVLTGVPKNCVKGNDFFNYVSDEENDSIIIEEDFQQFNHEEDE